MDFQPRTCGQTGPGSAGVHLSGSPPLIPRMGRTDASGVPLHLPAPFPPSLPRVFGMPCVRLLSLGFAGLRVFPQVWGGKRSQRGAGLPCMGGVCRGVGLVAESLTPSPRTCRAVTSAELRNP